LGHDEHFLTKGAGLDKRFAKQVETFGNGYYLETSIELLKWAEE